MLNSVFEVDLELEKVPDRSITRISFDLCFPFSPIEGPRRVEEWKFPLVSLIYRRVICMANEVNLELKRCIIFLHYLSSKFSR